MVTIPQDQRAKHPELYPKLKTKEEYIQHILQMCDEASKKRANRDRLP